MSHSYSLFGPCNKLFSASDSDVLASLCIGYTNLGSTTKSMQIKIKGKINQNDVIRDIRVKADQRVYLSGKTFKN